MKNCTKIDKCPITDQNHNIPYFDLGNIPLVNNLLDTREESLNCDKYPLRVNYFPKSGISALSHAVDGDLLFKDYLFKSGVNIPYFKHCQDMFLNEISEIPNGSIVVDIGGNDGTLIEAFKSVNPTPTTYLNIDPSQNNIIENKKKGITFINSFFTEELTKKLNFKADYIISTNVFQHLKDIKDFAKGIKNMLSEDGSWILEFPYWLQSMHTNQFDQVYHEHMYYHSITPLHLMFTQLGLEITNISFHEMHGGSLRLQINHFDSRPQHTSVQEYLDAEMEELNPRYHLNWGEKINAYITESREKLLELINDDEIVVGFGAAAKGCIFLNAMGLTNDHIPFIMDDTKEKQNKFIPGTGIEIIPRDILRSFDADYILILAHNFKDHIMKSLKEYGYKGKFIILSPEFKIYE